MKQRHVFQCEQVCMGSMWCTSYLNWQSKGRSAMSVKKEEYEKIERW